MRVLCVGGERHGTTIDVAGVSPLGTAEGPVVDYGMVNTYGWPDPDDVWPLHSQHRPELARLDTVFSAGLPPMEQSGVAAIAMVESAFEMWKAAQE